MCILREAAALIEAIDCFDGSVIIVTHSEMMLHVLATRLIVFDDGKVTFFEGTYQDFLDRVGWKNESGSVIPAAKKKQAGNDVVNKKELRRIRADLISQRTKSLAALKKSINNAEHEIVLLEEKIELINRKMLEISQNSQGETIKNLSKEIHESQKKIDSLFLNLEELQTEHDRKAKEYEEKFESLSMMQM